MTDVQQHGHRRGETNEIRDQRMLKWMQEKIDDPDFLPVFKAASYLVVAIALADGTLAEKGDNDPRGKIRAYVEAAGEEIKKANALYYNEEYERNLRQREILHEFCTEGIRTGESIAEFKRIYGGLTLEHELRQLKADHMSKLNDIGTDEEEETAEAGAAESACRMLSELYSHE